MLFLTAVGKILLAWTFILPLARASAASLQGSDLTLRRRTTNSTESAACTTIKSVLSSSSSGSQVLYPLDLDYLSYSSHFMTSSQQYPSCVVLPKSPADLAAVVKIIGDKRVRFAVSSGSHASNQGFSSTPGVHITMKGFQQVRLSNDKSQVDVGPANIWDNVYQVLTPSGVAVVGGRVTGVGVGGFITGGGGYSWLTNQRGLTVDSLISADIVLPDGTATTASASQNPDLFWAIKGGGNRFGIVYNFRLKTVPLGQVYGGLRTYTFDQVDNIANATYEFSENNKDPKAQIIPTFNFILGQPGVSLLGFYDGATPPSDVFSAFGKDQARPFTDGWTTSDFPTMIRNTPANATSGQRGAFHTVSLQRYSREMMTLIVSEMKRYGAIGMLHSASIISYDVEPFLPYSQFATESAWPHKTNALPLNIYFGWLDPGQDAFWHKEIQKTAEIIAAQARSEGQNLDNLYLYPNYAVGGTSSEAIYGPNLERLRRLRDVYDPTGVMGLTTYFDF